MYRATGAAFGVVLLTATTVFGAASDFSIDFSHKPGGIQNCDLVFNRGVPSPNEVDALLRKALDVCLSGNRGSDVLATAFHGDEPLESGRAYSGYLVYRHGLGQVRTEAQEEGLKTSSEDRHNYALIIEERTRPDAPRQYITLFLVYKTWPPLDSARAAEIQEAGRLSGRGADVYVTAVVGDKSRPPSWKPIQKETGQVLTVKYDATKKTIGEGW